MPELAAREEAISAARDFINRFGYIRWNRLEKIEYDEVRGDWVIILVADEVESDVSHGYEMRLSRMSGRVEKFEMVGYTI